MDCSNEGMTPSRFADMPDCGQQYPEQGPRELRRLELALRMLRLQARTRTVCDWTGLSQRRVQGISREYAAARGMRATDRLRGPSPSTLSPFWESRRLRREAAALAGLCCLYGVMGNAAGSDRLRLPDLRRGGRLCQAYETYLSLLSEPRVSLEHAVLLVRALVRGTEIALSRCADCRTVVLIDRLGGIRGHCTYCAS